MLNEPGASWDYGHSTDVVGRIIEVVSGQTLGAFLHERIFAPLGMPDTGFSVRADKHDRLAKPFANDPDSGAPVKLFTPDHTEFRNGRRRARRRRWTITHGSRRCSISAARSAARGILGRKTLEFMTSDHLGPNVRIGTLRCWHPGHGFGLGFAVRREVGMAATPGTPGEFFWGGLAGTVFWIAPKEELIAMMMIQAPGQRDYYRQLFRILVHAAIT